MQKSGKICWFWGKFWAIQYKIELLHMLKNRVGGVWTNCKNGECISFTANSFSDFFFRHPSPLPFVVSIFRRHLHSTRPYYALRRSHFFAAISIAAMLTQLHLKNAPKFVSLFAGDAAAARENMSKISREKMERQGSAFDCLQLS